MDSSTPGKIPVGPSEPPKKYIRTYGGDMEAVKRGGRPDLAPLPEPAPPAIERKDRANLPPALPPLEKIAVAHSAPPPPRQIPPQAPPLPVPPPAPQPLPPPPPPPAPEARPVPLQTYQDDFARRVQDQRASTASILAAQEDARRGAPNIPKEEVSTGSALYVIAGVALLLIGGAGAYYGYATYLVKQAPVIIAPVATAPIFVDDRQEVSGTGRDLLAQVEASVASPIAQGAVRFLYLPVSATTSGSVFAALDLPAPGKLARNVSADGSMAGVILESDSTQSPFFILSVSSYGETFSGMLSWEPTMLADLSALYPEPAPPVTETATTTATTTPAASALPQKTLRQGSSGEDVRKLQTLLALDPALYPEALVTGAYGSLTVRAVQRFQAKYGVVSGGTPATTGYGAVGAKTLAKLAEVFGGGAAGALADTASSTAPIVVTPNAGFRDEVVANHDARVYRDEYGRTLLVYGYWNQSTLVIARDQAAFSEIVNRLATSRGGN
jgi:hypothetical protein